MKHITTMGTRSLTHIYEANHTGRFDGIDAFETPKDGKPLLTFYRQFDGYPEGHGKELADFLKGITMVNGIRGGAEAKLGAMANTEGCLAAQVIVHFKTEVGGIYIYPANASDCGEEFVYHVFFKHDGINLRICDGDNEQLWEGHVSKLDAWLAEEKAKQ